MVFPFFHEALTAARPGVHFLFREMGGLTFGVMVSTRATASTFGLRLSGGGWSLESSYGYCLG
jgi:hypothetical protein